MSGGKWSWRRAQGKAHCHHELEQELASHVEMRAEELRRRGLDPEQARREANARLGQRDVLYASAHMRDQRLRRAVWFDGLRRDLREGLRRARKASGATLLTMLTFALGIGLTTAGYTILDRILIRSLPFPESQQLVVLESVDQNRQAFPRVSAASWLEWHEHNSSLEASALLQPYEWALAADQGQGARHNVARRIAGQRVSSDFFRVLGAPLIAGRSFTSEEVREGKGLAVISERLWRGTWGNRPPPFSVVLDGSTVEVVGVLPDRYRYPVQSDLWLAFEPRQSQHPEAHTWINFQAVARLSPGITQDRAAADLTQISADILARNPRAIYAHGAGVLALQELVVGNSRQYLLLLMASVVLVLCIVCANLTGLGLARLRARRQEMAVRRALGASRGRLVRQLLIEQLVPALAGGVLGTGLAAVATRLVAAHAQAFLPRAEEIALDWRILIFAFVVSLLAGVGSGLLPALRAAGSGVQEAVRGSHLRIGGGRRLPGASMVALEVALALLLVSCGGLLLRSFQVLVSRDLGFSTERLVTARVNLATPQYDTEDARLRYWQELAQNLRALPLIETVGLARATPGGYGANGFVEVDGQPGEQRSAGYRVVDEHYFDALAIPRLVGRTFARSDSSVGERVVVVNQSMAKTFWPDGNALGQRVRALSMELREGSPWLRVVGVVADVRHFGWETAPEPEMFVLYRRVPSWAKEMTLVVRVRAGAESSRQATEALRLEIARLDPQLAPDIATLESLVGHYLVERRFVLRILAGFSILALGLAAIGVYAMLSHAVSRRRREIGVRSALGAGRESIVAMVLRSALAVVAVGLVLGLGATYWLTGLMRDMLVEISPHDPASFTIAVGTLLAAALAAALSPAWRAARVDPIKVLRSE